MTCIAMISVAIALLIIHYTNEYLEKNQIAATEFCKKISQEEDFKYYAANSKYETNIFKCELSNNNKTLPEKSINIRKNEKTGDFERDLPNYKEN